MIRFIITGAVFFVLLSATICYAGNGKPCMILKFDTKKEACKTSKKLIPEKLLKIKSINQSKSLERPSVVPSDKSSSAAETFESLIAPFLKAVSPHFYDQIIKREQKVAPLAL